jgi:hypothetical protein
MKKITLIAILFIVSGKMLGQAPAKDNKPAKNGAATEKEITSNSFDKANENKVSPSQEKPLVQCNERVLKSTVIISQDTVKDPAERSKAQNAQQMENEKKKKGN